MVYGLTGVIWGADLAVGISSVVIGDDMRLRCADQKPPACLTLSTTIARPVRTCNTSALYFSILWLRLRFLSARIGILPYQNRVAIDRRSGNIQLPSSDSLRPHFWFQIDEIEKDYAQIDRWSFRTAPSTHISGQDLGSRCAAGHKAFPTVADRKTDRGVM